MIKSGTKNKAKRATTKRSRQREEARRCADQRHADRLARQDAQAHNPHNQRLLVALLLGLLLRPNP